MRNWKAKVIFLSLIAMPCIGQQHASVSVVADDHLLHDVRPFGKYLVALCTLSADAGGKNYTRTVQCPKLPFPGSPVNLLHAVIQPKDQTVSLKLICDPNAKDPCDLANPKVGTDFFVTATADSGLPAQQKVLLGNVMPIGGSNVVRYRAISPGPIIIRATAPATSLFSAASPVDLILQADADASSGSRSCLVLPASTPGSQSSPLDAATIIGLLGNPTPFILVAQGSNTIAIYSTHQPLAGNEPKLLSSFQDEIAALAGRSAASLGIPPTTRKLFSVELIIPHGNALGDIAAKLNTLTTTSSPYWMWVEVKYV